MINLVLFGPPGSGKGTQAKLIVNYHELIHISTGDVFRKNIQDNTSLGKLARSYMDKGQLVPDQVTIDLLSSELDSYSDSKGFIFDGFPRTILQAKNLDILMNNQNMHISMVISLEVSENELVKRLLNRGLDSGRADDQDESIVRNRIQVYENQTSVLKKYYSEKLENAFFSINGERDVDDIFSDLKKILLKYKID
ncbi:MAG: adenylate kinase [Flavobacteriales bacterium]|nr:adenylate kinase [Flavobacteriales bacterium]